MDLLDEFLFGQMLSVVQVGNGVDLEPVLLAELDHLLPHHPIIHDFAIVELRLRPVGIGKGDARPPEARILQ